MFFFLQGATPVRKRSRKPWQVQTRDLKMSSITLSPFFIGRHVPTFHLHKPYWSCTIFWVCSAKCWALRVLPASSWKTTRVAKNKRCTKMKSITSTDGTAGSRSCTHPSQSRSAWQVDSICTRHRRHPRITHCCQRQHLSKQQKSLAGFAGQTRCWTKQNTARLRHGLGGTFNEPGSRHPSRKRARLLTGPLLDWPHPPRPPHEHRHHRHRYRPRPRRGCLLQSSRIATSSAFRQCMPSNTFTFELSELPVLHDKHSRFSFLETIKTIITQILQFCTCHTIPSHICWELTESDHESTDSLSHSLSYPRSKTYVTSLPRRNTVNRKPFSASRRTLYLMGIHGKFWIGDNEGCTVACARTRRKQWIFR